MRESIVEIPDLSKARFRLCQHRILQSKRCCTALAEICIRCTSNGFFSLTQSHVIRTNFIEEPCTVLRFSSMFATSPRMLFHLKTAEKLKDVSSQNARLQCLPSWNFTAFCGMSDGNLFVETTEVFIEFQKMIHRCALLIGSYRNDSGNGENISMSDGKDFLQKEITSWARNSISVLATQQVLRYSTLRLAKSWINGKCVRNLMPKMR